MNLPRPLEMVASRGAKAEKLTVSRDGTPDYAPQYSLYVDGGYRVATIHGPRELAELFATLPLLYAACERAECALDSKLAVGCLSASSEAHALRLLREALRPT